MQNAGWITPYHFSAPHPTIFRHLDQIAKSLIEEWGYDTLTAMKAVKDEVLEQIGMKHGHIAVLRNAITEQ